MICVELDVRRALPLRQESTIAHLLALMNIVFGNKFLGGMCHHNGTPVILLTRLECLFRGEAAEASMIAARQTDLASSIARIHK